MKDSGQSIQNLDASTTGPVTTTITQHIKRGKEKEFESWLLHVGHVAETFDGHQGLIVLPPLQSGSRYTYIFRFDSYAHLQAWEQSPERDQCVRQLRGLLAAPPRKQIITGLEYWFRLPGDATVSPPRRYKMAAVTVLAIFPLSLVVPRLMQPHILFLPSLLRSLCYTIVLVSLMTYVVMPMMTRLFAPWLFNKSFLTNLRSHHD
jgi:uncharacterized protein